MTTKKRVGTVFFYGVAILLAVIALIPFLWMISTSFKSRGALMSIPIEWIPENPTWDAYIKVFSKFPFAKTIDTAFSRRFNYKIEFKKPNLEERLLLWEKLLPKNAPYEKNFNLKSLADFPLTGGQISLIIKNSAFLVAAQKSPLFTIQIFIDEIKRELNSNFDGQREMGFHI